MKSRLLFALVPSACVCMVAASIAALTGDPFTSVIGALAGVLGMIVVMVWVLVD